MQRADRSISLQDRLFVVLTKVDLFDRPDENGNWHWQLAVRNFKDQAIDRVFPYSKVWAHQGVDTAHPVAASSGLLQPDAARVGAGDAPGRHRRYLSRTWRPSIASVGAITSAEFASSRPSSAAPRER
jgi:hypothetical protein